MDFDWWNTIQAGVKLPDVHLVQWLGMFWLDFGRWFHGTWWNINCSACALWVKERFNFHMIKKVKCEPLCTTPDSMTSFVRRKNTQTQWLVQAFQLLWYDWCEICTLMRQSDWCEIHTLMWRSDWYEMQTLIRRSNLCKQYTNQHANTELFFN